LNTGLDALLIEDRTPLIAEGTNVIPSGSDRFKKTERGLVYFEIYEPLLLAPRDPAKPVPIALQVMVFDVASGEKKVDSGLYRIATPETSGNPVVPHGLTLPLSTLPPGAYRLEVMAANGIAKPVVRSTNFQVLQ
jgi:hypothetical protein